MGEVAARVNQVGGYHYKLLDVEPHILMMFLEEQGFALSHEVAHIIPYVFRYKLKGGLQDLEKAVDWIEKRRVRGKKVERLSKIDFNYHKDAILNEFPLLEDIHLQLILDLLQNNLTAARKNIEFLMEDYYYE